MTLIKNCTNYVNKNFKIYFIFFTCILCLCILSVYIVKNLPGRYTTITVGTDSKKKFLLLTQYKVIYGIMTILPKELLLLTMASSNQPKVD